MPVSRGGTREGDDDVAEQHVEAAHLGRVGVGVLEVTRRDGQVVRGGGKAAVDEPQLQGSPGPKAQGGVSMAEASADTALQHAERALGLGVAVALVRHAEEALVTTSCASRRRRGRR